MPNKDTLGLDVHFLEPSVENDPDDALSFDTDSVIL